MNAGGAEKCPKLFLSHAPREMALISIGDRPGFLGDHHHDRIGFLA